MRVTHHTAVTGAATHAREKEERHQARDHATVLVLDPDPAGWGTLWGRGASLLRLLNNDHLRLWLHDSRRCSLLSDSLAFHFLLRFS